jgi:hypothetical protein
MPVKSLTQLAVNREMLEADPTDYYKSRGFQRRSRWQKYDSFMKGIADGWHEVRPLSAR